jgi:hypothetical protein
MAKTNAYHALRKAETIGDPGPRYTPGRANSILGRANRAAVVRERGGEGAADAIMNARGDRTPAKLHDIELPAEKPLQRREAPMRKITRARSVSGKR